MRDRIRDLVIPDEIREALIGGAALAVSISGGKDSQAMLAAVAAQHRSRKWLGELYAIHADLGRAEWPQSLPHCQAQCDALGIELVIVRRPQGDMVARWQQRMHALEGTGKPFWSSNSNRYCTSELKRNQIDKYLRRHKQVISIEGIRAQESTNRAKKPVWSMRENICTRDRTAYTWNAILDWQIEDVWQACGTDCTDLERRRKIYREGFHNEALAGWPMHPAYVFGNDRVSCSLCVLASRSDLRIGATHNPELYQILTSMERESGFSFRDGDALIHLFEHKPRGLASQPVIAIPEAQLELDFICC